MIWILLNVLLFYALKLTNDEYDNKNNWYLLCFLQYIKTFVEVYSLLVAFKCLYIKSGFNTIVVLLDIIKKNIQTRLYISKYHNHKVQ